jgi:hypothetical protein
MAPLGSSALLQLCSCLRGRIPGDVNWEAVIAAANHAFLTAEVAVALRADPPLAGAPRHVRNYFAHIHAQNLKRNQILRAQLIDLVVALNAVGVTPTLTKGSAFVAQMSGERLGARMMHDLDLCVAANELHITHGVLRCLGYRELPGIGWGRPQDPGVVDLHFPPGRYPAYWPDEVMRHRHLTLMTFDGAVAHAPSAFLRARHCLVHDQIKNGSWWLCNVNLRDVYELHQLTKEHEINWMSLQASLPDQLAKLSLASQYLVMCALFGAPQAGEAPSISAVSRTHANLRLRDPDGPLARATEMLGRYLWWLRCGQIRWRTRQSTRHIVERVAVKLARPLLRLL